MQINPWLAKLCLQLQRVERRIHSRRVRREDRFAPSLVESLEPRQFLSAAPVPVGLETRINTVTTSDQNVPSVAMNAAGSYVTVWDSSGQDGNNNGIEAREYYSTGLAKSAEFRVNTYTTGNQSASAVAIDSAGRFVVVWQSDGQDGSGAGIYAQRYNIAGAAEETEFRVNTFTTGNQVSPAVAMDAVGDFVITWQSLGQDGSSYGIYAQRYNSVGVAQGGEFRVNSYITGNQLAPSVAMDAAGDFAVTWTSPGLDGSDYGVFAQRYNSSGADQGSTFQINTDTTGNQGSSYVAMDVLGDFVVTWVSFGQDGGGYGVYAQRYSASGLAQGSEFQVNSYTTGAQSGPIVTMNLTGSFVITWRSFAEDGSEYGVYAKSYSPAGLGQGSELRVNTYTMNRQDSASVAMDSSGNFVVVWESSGQDGSGSGIYSQRYAAKVNHAPVGTAGTSIAVENTGYKFKGSDFGFTDPNDSPPNALLAVKFTTLPAAGKLTDNGIAVTVNQLVTAADITAGKLIFTPTANLKGTFFLCRFQVQDNGGTINGGVNLDPIPKILDVNLVNPNHAPVGAAKTVTTLEDIAYVFKIADFGFADASDHPANTLLTVKIATLPLLGSLTDNAITVTAETRILATDISSGKLKFAPGKNGNGATYASFTFQVQDNGGTANGGIDTDPAPRKLTLAVTSVNDAPFGAAHTISMSKNTAYVFQATDFGFADSSDSPPNAFLSVKITTLPALGKLTNGGIVVAAGARISLTDIAAGILKFTPALNGTGPAYASFTFQVQDNGGIVNGGIDTDLTPRKMTITVI